MPKIKWTIEVEDHEGKIIFYEPDAVIDFHINTEYGEATIFVESFTNCRGSYFSVDAEGLKRAIYFETCEQLEENEEFCEKCHELVNDEYKPVNFGLNSPDAKIEQGA